MFLYLIKGFDLVDLDATLILPVYISPI